MPETQPNRRQADLAEMVEMLLDKGVVINADVVVSIGDTELLGVKVRAAIASFETAAAYGLEFPEGTDMDRVEAAAGGERGPGLPDGDVPVEVTGVTAPTKPAFVGAEEAEPADDDEAAEDAEAEVEAEDESTDEETEEEEAPEATATTSEADDTDDED